MAAHASSSVQLVTPLPLLLGNLPAGGQAEYNLKFAVPTGVKSFKVSSYTSTQDNCGNSFYFPTAPPAS